MKIPAGVFISSIKILFLFGLEGGYFGEVGGEVFVGEGVVLEVAGEVFVLGGHVDESVAGEVE